MNKISLKPMNIFNILTKATVLYFKNIVPLSRAMLFPVFGQVLGVIFILLVTFILSKNISSMLPNDPDLSSIVGVFLLLIIITLPGFFIFTMAFWEYMVAMVSLNSMTANIIKEGSIRDIKIHNQAAKLKSKDYIILLFILSLIWLIGLLAPSIIFLFRTSAGVESLPISLGFVGLEFGAVFILIIISVYLSLCFQVFSFEDLSPVRVLKRSWYLVEGNFWRTFVLGAIVSIITGMLVPYIFQKIVEQTAIMSVVISPFKIYASTLITDPENFVKFFNFGQGSVASIDLMSEISKFMALSILGIIITAFLLPLGSACYTLLYFDVITRKTPKNKK